MRRAARVAIAVLAVLALGACDGSDGEPVVGGATGAPPDEPPPEEPASAPSAAGTPDAPATGGPSGAVTETPTSPSGTGTEGPSIVEDPLPGSTWSARADAPITLTEVAAAPYGGRVWVAGGYAATGMSVTEVQVYDPATDSWSAGPPLPEGVNHSALVAAGDQLVLVGGYLGDNTPTDAVRVLDPATGAWTDGPPLPEPRGAGAAAWDGERVVYGGGVGPDGVAGDVWALEGDAWQPLTAELVPAREHLAAASDGDGTVWFLGGRLGGIDQNQTAVDVVDGDGVTPLGDLPTGRGGVSGFHVEGVGACSAGGEGPQGTYAEVECISASGVVTTLPPLPEPRHGIGAVVLDAVAYVLLGGPEPGLTVSPTVQALGLDRG